MTKKDLASEEAVRLKKLMGGLRYLWRSSPFAVHMSKCDIVYMTYALQQLLHSPGPDGAHNERVAELKAMLEDSPTRCRPRDPAENRSTAETCHL